MRRYDDPVETRMGQVSGTEGPEQFLWRGRLWKVRAVLAHWVETGPWWQSGGARAVIGSDEPAPRPTGGRSGPRGADLLGERELWRVEAGRGPGAGGDGRRARRGRGLRPLLRLERRALGARRLRGLTERADDGHPSTTVHDRPTRSRCRRPPTPTSPGPPSR